MTVEEFLRLNKSTQSYSVYWRYLKEEEDQDSWMQREDAITSAKENLSLFEERLEAFEVNGGPRVGEWIIGFDGTMTRFTHAWEDGIQTGGGQGSFYLCSSSLSYSGGLDSSVPYDLVELTEERKMGQCWIFHHGCSGAHRSVYYNHPFRVWKTKTIADPRDIERLPYQYKVAEVTEKLYNDALGAVPPIAMNNGFFAMGEAYSHQGAVPTYYCFQRFNGRYFCVIETIEEAKIKFTDFFVKLGVNQVN